MLDIDEALPDRRLSLTNLLPDQIVERWDVVYTTLSESLPNDHNVTGIMQQLIRGFGQVWLAELGSEPIGVIVTTIQFDGLLGEKTLLIYAFKALRVLKQSEYLEGFAQLQMSAKRFKCSAIVAYSNIDYIKRISKHLGADIATTVRWDIA